MAKSGGRTKLHKGVLYTSYFYCGAPIGMRFVEVRATSLAKAERVCLNDWGFKPKKLLGSCLPDHRLAMRRAVKAATKHIVERPYMDMIRISR